jgi:hypothetical protein
MVHRSIKDVIYPGGVYNSVMPLKRSLRKTLNEEEEIKLKYDINKD